MLEAMRGEGQPPDLEQQIAQLQARMDTIKEFTLCYTAALQVGARKGGGGKRGGREREGGADAVLG